ncbi:glycosyltransferase family protein [Microbacterium excoecariae]|uniref:glycosyltransferase family protein n=1 Tax=Microbacterium excoecariae TaxID=2715210 RepID=UPI00140D91E0|nr:glycosyltransferase [Microbacterium excoecariae]NHI16913.1 glycosyl transferase family 28 [Microbacterium excoecariae]
MTIMTSDARDTGAGVGERAPRVALYSHDAMGLGHIRRNLALARALAAGGARPDILLLTSAPEAACHELPDRTDVVALPGVAKNARGSYGPRRLSLAGEHLARIRADILRAALEGFAPDVLIVDKHARGLGGELEGALDVLARRGTRIVLGLRDVLDAAPAARRDWRADGTAGALERWYTDVWVYGDRSVHDPLKGLEVPPALRTRVAYTGYLARGRVMPRPGARERLVVGMVGGGSDGQALAHAFARAELPAGHRGVLVTGPQMPARDREDLARLAARRADLEVRTFVPDGSDLIARASAVVGMGGYNTVCEALAAGTPILVVPRVRPRREQLVRAVAMRRRGLVDTLHPDDLSPAAIGRWLAAPGDPTARTGNLDGLATVADLFGALVAAPRRERTVA